MSRAFVGEWWFLSNYAPAQVVFEGLVYPTCEHAFAAAKTLDAFERGKIQTAPSPGAAKAIGRRVQLRPDWEAVKTGVMRALLISKFSNPELGRQLLATGERELIEENDWHDVIWGKCGCSRHQGAGENRLGRLLMEVRADLNRDQ